MRCFDSFRLPDISPEKLILMDGIGALVSSLLSFIVLSGYRPVFGIPGPMLNILVFSPVAIAAYGFSCVFVFRKNIGLKLKVIAYFNAIYCLLSATSALYYGAAVTFWGWLYLLSEIAIVLALASFEFRVSKAFKKN